MKKIMAIGLMFAILIATFSGCGGNALDPLDHITVEFSGLDGKGKANVQLDDAFEEKMLKAAGYKEGADPFQFLELYGAFDYELSKDSELSNGDKITVTITTDESILKQYKISLKDGSKDFTVAGLEEGQDLDLFADVALVLEGASPFLTVKVHSSTNDAFLSTVRYQVENGQNRKIGDEILVKATFNQSAAEEKGYLIENSEKIFILEKADKNVEAFAELPQEFLDKISSEVMDTTTSAFANNGGSMAYLISNKVSYNMYSSENTFSDPVIKEMLLITPKPSNSYGETSSTIFVTAEVVVTGKDNETDVLPIYVTVPNVVLHEDGTISADFGRLDYKYTAKVQDSSKLIEQLENKHKAKYTTEVKSINASSTMDKATEKESSIEEVVYYLPETHDFEPQYTPVIAFYKDGSFVYIVNLLSGMGEIKGTYTVNNGIYSCTITVKDFGGGYRGEDVTSFTLTPAGDKLVLGGDIGTGIGSAVPNDVFLKVDEKPENLA